jgi:hypothetical protein
MKKTGTAVAHSRLRHRTGRGELLQVIRAIQELTLELAQVRNEEHTAELKAKERRLEQLRWRLAAVARRHATDDYGAAA